MKSSCAGYVVVAPDYEGLGEPGGRELHPFLNVKSEAYSITDAVVATSKNLGNKRLESLDCYWPFTRWTCRIRCC